MSPTKLSNMVPSRKRSPVSLNNSLLTGDPHTARLTSVPSQIPADLCISQRASLAPDRLANSMTRKSGNKPNLRFGLLVQLKEHHLLTTHQDLNLPRSSSPFLVELQVSTRKWVRSTLIRFQRPRDRHPRRNLGILSRMLLIVPTTSILTWARAGSAHWADQEWIRHTRLSEYGLSKAFFRHPLTVPAKKAETNKANNGTERRRLGKTAEPAKDDSDRCSD